MCRFCPCTCFFYENLGTSTKSVLQVILWWMFALNWLNCFLFPFLVGGLLLIILICCMIFLASFVDVRQVSVSAVSYLQHKFDSEIFSEKVVFLQTFFTYLTTNCPRANFGSLEEGQPHFPESLSYYLTMRQMSVRILQPSWVPRLVWVPNWVCNNFIIPNTMFSLTGSFSFNLRSEQLRV